MIAERAGVSRGAQLHHFPTKAELVSAAVEHLANKDGKDLAAAASKLPAGATRVEAVIDLLWARFTSPLFAAWLELWVAARTDPELRATTRQFEQRLRAKGEGRLHSLFGEEIAAAPDFEVVRALTFHVLEGMALDRTLQANVPGRLARERQVLAMWKRLVKELLVGSTR